MIGVGKRKLIELDRDYENGEMIRARFLYWVPPPSRAQEHS